MLQLLHAEAAQKGASLQWAVWLDPEPELLKRFDSANLETDEMTAWRQLEPSTPHS